VYRTLTSVKISKPFCTKTFVSISFNEPNVMAQKKRLILYLALTWLRKIESWYFWRVTLEILKVRYEHVNFCSRFEKNVEVPFLHLGGTGKRFNKNKLFSEEFWLHKITVILSESQQFCNISLKSCNGVSSASTGVTKTWSTMFTLNKLLKLIMNSIWYSSIFLKILESY